METLLQQLKMSIIKEFNIIFLALPQNFRHNCRMDKKQKTKNMILSVLCGHPDPISSGKITERLHAAGVTLSERAVRLHLAETDDEGLTENHPRKGRTITPLGVEELRVSQAIQRVGYLSAKIDQMTYRMGFDLQRRSGTVVVNTSIVDIPLLYRYVRDVCEVFRQGYAMGNRMCLLTEGERIGEVTIPRGKVGFCTVCSITINGVLLKHGIPSTSRFGGLLEMRGGQPTRFVEVIHYDGTSIDPLEVFIRSGMTDYHGAITGGNGRIGASFRELPADSRELVLHLAEELDAIGLGAIMEIGMADQAVHGVPVSPGRIGMILIGGLNPIAILEERNHRIDSMALSGLLEFNRLHSFEELPQRLKRLL